MSFLRRLFTFKRPKAFSKSMIEAAREGDLGMVRTMVLQGLSVNVKDERGNTALILASHYSDNTELVRFLLDSGADLNARDNDGCTALRSAVQRRNRQVIKLLL